MAEPQICFTFVDNGDRPDRTVLVLSSAFGNATRIIWRDAAKARRDALEILASCGPGEIDPVDSELDWAILTKYAERNRSLEKRVAAALAVLTGEPGDPYDKIDAAVKALQEGAE